MERAGAGGGRTRRQEEPTPEALRLNICDGAREGEGRHARVVGEQCTRAFATSAPLLLTAQAGSRKREKRATEARGR